MARWELVLLSESVKSIQSQRISSRSRSLVTTVTWVVLSKLIVSAYHSPSGGFCPNLPSRSRSAANLHSSASSSCPFLPPFRFSAFSYPRDPLTLLISTSIPVPRTPKHAQAHDVGSLFHKSRNSKRTSKKKKISFKVTSDSSNRCFRSLDKPEWRSHQSKASTSIHWFLR